MIKVGMRAWNSQRFLECAIISVLGFADEIIITAGPENAVLLRHLRKVLDTNITTIWSNTRDVSEAIRITYDAAHEGDLYFWLDGYECMTQELKTEILEKLITIVEKGLPIVAHTLYFYPDIKHTLHTPKFDSLYFRGCLVDHHKPLDLASSEYFKLKNTVFNYSLLDNKGIIQIYTGEHPQCIVTLR